MRRRRRRRHRHGTSLRTVSGGDAGKRTALGRPRDSSAAGSVHTHSLSFSFAHARAHRRPLAALPTPNDHSVHHSFLLFAFTASPAQHVAAAVVMYTAPCVCVYIHRHAADDWRARRTRNNPAPGCSIHSVTVAARRPLHVHIRVPGVKPRAARTFPCVPIKLNNKKKQFF